MTTETTKETPAPELDNRDAEYRAYIAAVRSGFYTHASPNAQATPSYRARMGSAYRWVVRQAGVLALILSSLLWIAHLLGAITT